jgi:glycosyltransferase involved in cell wall biosynthesis
MSKIDVEVLLCTYNGEKYLKEFLSSLASQSDVNIYLSVSDDGSTDESLQIIRENWTLNGHLKIFHGPMRGPAENFFFLMSKAQKRFILLADQDDIWEPNHAINSIKRIIEMPGPAMTYCKSVTFGEGVTEAIWPEGDQIPTISNFLVENFARGCTIGLNQELIRLVNSKKPKHAIMHDWWIALLAHTCGTIIFCPIVEVNYRLHESNAVGVSNFNLIERITNIRRLNSWRPLLQAHELLQTFGDVMNPSKRREIEEFCCNLNNGLSGRFKIALSRRRYRIKMKEELMLRVGFIFLPVLFPANRIND